MEFWPKKKAKEREKPLVFTEKNPIGFSEGEIAGLSRDFDDIPTKEAFLERVDFQVLNEIFDKLKGKVESVQTREHRVVPDSILFIDKEDVEKHAMEGVGGRASVVEGRIKLVWKSSEGNDTAENLTLLKTLIHESAHIRGGYVEAHTDEWVTPLTLKTEGNVRTGLNETIFTIVDGKQQGELMGHALSLNEALTEEIAHDVFREYLLRTGNSGYLKNQALHTEIRGSYFDDRVMLHVVVHALAKELGTSEEEVFRGFVHTYMSGSVELEELFRDIEAELADDPVALDLVEKLKANHSQTLDLESLPRLIDREPSPYGQIRLLQRMGGPLSRNKAMHVLGLR